MEMSRDIDGFETLDESECMALLARMRHPIGRVGVGIGVVPMIFPVNYALAGGAVYFFTGVGVKLRAALKNQVVGFEIDEFDAQYHEGVSVFVMGIAEVITDPETVVWAHALVMPWAPGPRAELVRIVPEFVSGRRIRHGFVSPDDGPEEVVK
jgi:nitroimidazol reductase NimA-like FMN-containing flavoprotein (pyridoxamine 5'-phosphate oxidase superfamily)